MRILIIGNCQARQLARCLRIMLPEAVIESINYGGEGADKIRELSAKTDYVISHRAGSQAIQTILESIGVDLWIPRVIFNAFHPDQIMINAPNKKVEPSPIAGHSALALLCWKNGVPAAEAADWFRPEIYQRLGYDDYNRDATATLCAEGRAVGFPLEDALQRWKKNGCFMYLCNHPQLVVLSDVAEEIVRRLNLHARPCQPADYLIDQLRNGPIWPVYPGVAESFGLTGAYLFKRAQKDPRMIGNPQIIDLKTFLDESYLAFKRSDASFLQHPRLNLPAFEELGKSLRNPVVQITAPINTPIAAPKISAPQKAHPYKDLPEFHFWKRSIASVPAADVDPVVSLPWRIGNNDIICTAGSCFAQHISHTLASTGLNYRVFETAPVGMSESTAKSMNYGVFSARYANLYTTRQLRQLFERAFGSFVPSELPWLRTDGRFADPFRPEIEPEGFGSHEELDASRDRHLAAVREMFTHVDVFIFTLGLTEAWESRADGAVFPLAPGVVAGEFDSERYSFVNFSKAEVLEDLRLFYQSLRLINPKVRMILTVSPVPLAATFEKRSVLVSTLLSKSVLRVACEEFVSEHPDTFYFPSLELISGAFHRGSYFAEDLRTVTHEGVSHVMRLFLKHGVEATALNGGTSSEAEALMDTICEEERLDA